MWYLFKITGHNQNMAYLYYISTLETKKGLWDDLKQINFNQN